MGIVQQKQKGWTKIGAQTYNLWRTPLNILGKLQVISTLGYDSAELAGFNGTDYEGIDAKTLRTVVQNLGLELCGAHVPYAVFAEHMDAIIEYHQELGIHWVAIPRPKVECEDDMEQLILNMRDYARRLRKSGLDLYYHCHDFEFIPYRGMTTMDRILSETDVMLEIDVYWAAKGGINVMAFLDEYRDRVLYIHLKDADSEGPCAVGKGILDCHTYMEWAVKQQLAQVIVEDDRQLPDGITSICNSMQEIRSWKSKM